MPGFRSVGEWVDAAEGGQNWISSFRKGYPNTSRWQDVTGTTGSFPPNYFASSPLVGAAMPENKGIYAPNVGTRQYVKDFTIMHPGNSATSTAADNVTTILADYVMYYPFIDLTVVGTQVFDNPIDMPRYGGEGVQLLMLMQANSGVYSESVATISYEDSTGAVQSVSVLLPWFSFQTGQFVNALSGAVTGSVASNEGPFIPLKSGVRGIRKLLSVSLSADWGGLCTFILAKPLLTAYTPQGCRRTTTGNLDSFGAPTQTTNLIHRVGGAFFEDGAYLTPIVWAPSSNNGAFFCGTLETVWN